MLVLLFSALAHASGAYPLSLSGGLGPWFGSSTVGVVGQARLRWNGGRVGVEVAGREGVMSDAGVRTLGGLSVAGVWTPGDGPFLRAGFAHHHDTPWELARARPVAVLAGTQPGITHRTGLEVGAGWEWAAPERILGPRLGVAVEASATWFPDRGGPPLYVAVEPRIVYHLGRRRPDGTVEPSHAPE